MTLAVGKRAYYDIDLTVFSYRNARFFLHTAAAGLDVVTQTNTAQPAFGSALGDTGRIVLPVCLSQCHIQCLGEFTTADHHARGQGIRHFFGTDEIYLAQRHPIDAQLPSGALHNPFHHIASFWSSGTTIGSHRHSVGEHTTH